MSVVAIGLNHRSAPVALRERFAFAEGKIPDALKTLRDSGIASEAVILSTCNRVEIYAATTLAPKLIQPVIEACARYKAIPASFDAREMIDPALR